MPSVDLGGVAEFSHVSAPDGVTRGSRNDSLMRYAASLQARGVGDEEMLGACLAAAATMDPPLDGAEVMRIVRSVQRYPKGQASSLAARRQAPRAVPEVPWLPLREGHPELLPDWTGVSPLAMARAWVMANFEPQDVVCVVHDPTRGYRGGRGGGELYAYAGQLADPGDPLLARVVASAGPDGLWAVVNPLDGTGRRRGENVTAWRSLLVECDDLPADAQLERICALLMNVGGHGFDTATLTWSGGKSWHAVVRVQAASAEEYAARKEWIYAMCARNGLPVDAKCGNPTRLTRLAGAMRGGTLQRMAHCRRPGEAWRGGPAEWARR